MNRSVRASIARETVEIANRGWYEPSPQRRVNVAEGMRRALDGTVLFRPHEVDALSVWAANVAGSYATEITVTNESSLAAARRLVAERGEQRTLCLNFASAKNAGGGFLGGSQAQEESLARSSGLYPCLLLASEYYEANRRCDSCLYTDHMILSPQVPVFRDDDGLLLEEPYHVSFLTAPAVNAGAVRSNEPHLAAQISPTMARRIDQVLAVAKHRGYDCLVLGAWGCGVFRNDPAEIAGLFATVLRAPPFRGSFRVVTFAVLDRSADQQTWGAFQRHLAKESSDG
jgi:uncharacterized protein (TIGR02452 family)